ncbi:MAG TPA: 2-C-methyl-D-erythritol 4-phosphate cytidylyltransferase, partial [Spirochaetota bacterium]|nr:2-C-methyl-D-erythritol 4-phosphate cytidylyltransferase [Spirochaetota bacterium]
HLSFSGVKVATGGPKWIDQMVAAAEKISPDATHVLVHDAARPALPYIDLEEVMTQAEKSPAVCLAAPLRAPLFQVDASGAPMAVCPMGDYLQMLAPRAYTKAKFDEIVKAKAEPHGSEYKIVKGSAMNIRFGGGDAGLCKAALTMMPKPKAGTVTTDVKGIIKELKGGKVEYKADKTGVIHLGVGKMSFSDADIISNIKALYLQVAKDKPSDAKGNYIKTMFITSTMGPAVKINYKGIDK